VLGATRRPGIELVLDLAGFETALDGADLVITGELRRVGQMIARDRLAEAVTKAGTGHEPGTRR